MIPGICKLLPFSKPISLAMAEYFSKQLLCLPFILWPYHRSHPHCILFWWQVAGGQDARQKSSVHNWFAGSERPSLPKSTHWLSVCQCFFANSLLPSALQMAEVSIIILPHILLQAYLPDRFAHLPMETFPGRAQGKALPFAAFAKEIKYHLPFLPSGVDYTQCIMARKDKLHQPYWWSHCWNFPWIKTTVHPGTFSKRMRLSIGGMLQCKVWRMFLHRIHRIAVDQFV